MIIKKVLLVDDDPDEHSLFGEAWQAVRPNVKCEYASDGNEAFAVLERQGAHLPDVVFLDVNMPLENGWTLLTRLKEDKRFTALPVIIYTTSSYDRDKQIAQDLGAWLFLTKPFTSPELEKKLAQIVDKYDETFSTLT